MSIEDRVLTEIIRKKGMNVAASKGLKSEHFKDSEPQALFKYLSAHYKHPQTTGELPSLREIKKRFPGFILMDSDGTGLSSLVHELKLGSIQSDLTSLAKSFTELVESGDDPEGALNLMQMALPRIRLSHKGNSGFGASDMATYVRQQYALAQTGKNWGIKWPWDPLNRDTLGKHKGDFIVLYSRMKMMKTWLMYLAAAEDYFVNKQRVLIWTGDMGREKSILRFASIFAKVDYQVLKNGILPKPLWERTQRVLDAVAANLSQSPDEILDGKILLDREDLICLCGPDRPKTLGELRAFISMWEPTVVYLDSMYKLIPEGVSNRATTTEKLMHLAQQGKEMAVDLDVPIVATLQANRSGQGKAGEDLTDVYGSDAFGMEVDLILRVVLKKGRQELYEEEYEGYWKAEIERKEAAVKGRQIRRAERAPGLYLPTKFGNQSKKDKGMKTARQISNDIPEEEAGVKMPIKRKYGEIAVMLSGNRDGTLDGFLLRAVPGYEFKVIKEEFTSKEARKWLKEAAAEAAREEAGEGRGEERPEVNADTFKNMKRFRSQ